MKRVLGLTMAGILMFSATAFGATVDEAATTVNVPVLEKAADGKFDVTFGDTKTNNEYMLWVVKGVETTAANVSFTQADVMYIDQVTATAGGASFKDFLPMKTVDSTVLITGQGMTAPVIVGYIKADGNTLSGNIGLLRRTKNLGGAVVTLTDASGNAYSATTDTSNNFEITVPAGTYKLSVAKDGYLAYVDGQFVVDENTTWTKEITLLPGDMNNDGKIVTADLLAFKKAYQNKDLTCDFDGTGVIATGDLICFKAGWAAKTY